MVAKKNLKKRAKNKINSKFLKIDVTGPFPLVFSTPHESGFFYVGFDGSDPGYSQCSSWSACET
jgi:hypothetical protein